MLERFEDVNVFYDPEIEELYIECAEGELLAKYHAKPTRIELCKGCNCMTRNKFIAVCGKCGARRENV